MEDWVQKALAQWKEDELELNQGATFADIENIEKQIGYKFPDDFKQLYTVVNGFSDFESRGFFLSIWSLRKIADDYNKEKEFIMFSDYFLSVCQYGFHKSKSGIFKTYTHHQQGSGQYIAESFRQAVELINRDSKLLF